jgi:drug/metabolite transporter (DMT)-like permease
MTSSSSTGRHSQRGILLMLGAMLSLACSDAISKAMTLSLPPLEVAWIRFAIFTPVMLALAARSGGRIALRSQNPTIQILRSLGVVGSSIFFITALQYLPMAQATSISFVTPLLVTALAIPILGEVVGARRWAAIGVGLLGVIVIVRPGTGSFDPALILPLLAAASWSVALVLTRKMSSADGPLVALTYTALVGLALTSALLPFVWVTPGWHDMSFGLATACFYMLAQWLLVLAFNHAGAAVLAPFSYSQLIWSALLGFLIFDNLPDGWTLIGAAIIIASGLYTAHRERLQAKNEALRDAQEHPSPAS